MRISPFASAVVAALALCLALPASASGPGWTVRATPGAAAYGVIAFAAADDGLVVEAAPHGGSRVLQSRDGGSTWKAVASLPGTVEAFTFATPTDGWLWTQGPCTRTTCSSALHATTDGGRTWQRLAVPPGRIDAALRTTAQVGYVETVLGTKCTYLWCGTPALWRTADEGQTWQRVAVPDLGTWGFAAQGTRLLLADGYACPSGYASCQALVLRSVDAGRSWRTVLHPPGDNYQANSYGLAMSVHGSTAWFEAPIPGGGSMASGIGALYRSSDGGASWTEVAKAFAWGGNVLAGGPGFAGAPEGVLPDRAFAVVGTGAGAAEGGLALTLDAGRSWMRLAGLAGHQVYGAAWDGADAIWLTGGDGPLSQVGAGYLLRMSIGRRGRLTIRQVAPAVGPLVPLAGPSDEALFGGGTPSDSGAIVASNNGGGTWRVVASIADTELTGGQFVTRHVGYVYGEWLASDGLGAVWRTTDGGRTWRRVASGNYTVEALHMTSALAGERIITAGQWLSWQRTKDGGRTWTMLSRASTAYQTPLAAFGAQGGALLAAPAAEGGFEIEAAAGPHAAWLVGQSLPSPYPPAYFGASMSLVGACAALATGSVLYTSVDGGVHWHRVAVAGGQIEDLSVEPGCELITTSAAGEVTSAPMPY